MPREVHLLGEGWARLVTGVQTASFPHRPLSAPTGSFPAQRTDFLLMESSVTFPHRPLTVFFMSMVMVMGPTPPGTGVMSEHLGAT